MKNMIKNKQKSHKLLTFLAMCGIITGWTAVFGNKSASAVDYSGFSAGNIMSDHVMSDKDTMGVADIQWFLDVKVGFCDQWGSKWSEIGYGTRAQAAAHYGVALPLTCINIYSENGRSAAQIIYDTAQEFRINPQVLIVLLQKEQALITDEWPFPNQYKTATGFACPDTAPCDPNQMGFTNQLRKAAALFREVLNGGWTNYPVGSNYVQYSPDAACGGSVINIENRATSALYRYTPYQPNAGALAAGLGTSHCGAYGNRNFYYYFTNWFGDTRKEVMPGFSYSLHNIDGWSTTKTMAGTTGHSKMTSALKMSGMVEYSVYTTQGGWQPYINNHMVGGSFDSSQPIEMVAIKPLDDQYDVYYRVHNTGYGWYGWVKNGEKTGTYNLGSAIEALEVKIVRRGAEFLADSDNATVVNGVGVETARPASHLQYSAHVQNIGWQIPVEDSMIIGLPGHNLRIEDMKISLSGLEGGISYKAHIENSGWLNVARDGLTFGNTGRSLRMEAMMIALYGQAASNYDIYYRSFVEGYGWMNWAKNGEISGSVGIGARMEAIEIRLVKKTDTPPTNPYHQVAAIGNTSLPSNSLDLSYRAHIESIGWQDWVKNGEIAGTSGQALRVEAFEFDLKSFPNDGSYILCTAHVQDIGWMPEQQNSCGTTGQAKRVEAIGLNIAGAMADKYDIYYRAHIESIGWQDWVKNGEIAGTSGQALRVEAIEIIIKEKN